jgi:hypothetical protein
MRYEVSNRTHSRRPIHIASDFLKITLRRFSFSSSSECSVDFIEHETKMNAIEMLQMLVSHPWNVTGFVGFLLSQYHHHHQL